MPRTQPPPGRLQLQRGAGGVPPEREGAGEAVRNIASGRSVEPSSDTQQPASSPQHHGVCGGCFLLLLARVLPAVAVPPWQRARASCGDRILKAQALKS